MILFDIFLGKGLVYWEIMKKKVGEGRTTGICTSNGERCVTIVSLLREFRKPVTGRQVDYILGDRKFLVGMYQKDFL